MNLRISSLAHRQRPYETKRTTPVFLPLGLNRISTHRTKKSRKRFVPRAVQYSVGPSIISSAIAFGACYPMDTLKTRLQNDSSQKSCLFNGLLSGMVMCCLITSVYFGTYQVLTTVTSVFNATVLASLATTCVKVPCKCVTKLLQNGDFETARDVVVFVARKHGIKGFYRGFWAYALDDVPDTVLKFYFYSEIVRWISLDAVLVGFISGTLSSVLTQPMDVLQTILSCHLSDDPVDLTKINYFKGLSWAILINAVQSSLFLKIYYLLKSGGL